MSSENAQELREGECPDVDISELMRLGQDRPRPPLVQTTARVFCPGLPNPEGGWGLWATVRRLDQMGETRLMGRIQKSYKEREITVPGYEDLTDEERWVFWTKVHKLQQGIIRPRIDLEWAIRLVATDAGTGVTKELLDAFEKLNLAMPSVNELQLDQQDIALYPEIQRMWMAAARENKLVEFMAGDTAVTEPVRRWVRTITATQMLVLDEQAKAYARETGKAVQEILSPRFDELCKLLLQVNGYEVPEEEPEKKPE